MFYTGSLNLQCKINPECIKSNPMAMEKLQYFGEKLVKCNGRAVDFLGYDPPSNRSFVGVSCLYSSNKMVCEPLLTSTSILGAALRTDK